MRREEEFAIESETNDALAYTEVKDWERNR